MVRKAIGGPENKDFTSTSEYGIDLSEGVRTYFWTILGTCPCHDGKGLQKMLCCHLYDSYFRKETQKGSLPSGTGSCTKHEVSSWKLLNLPKQSIDNVQVCSLSKTHPGCSAAASFSLRKESKSQKLCRISCLMFSYPPFPFLVLGTNIQQRTSTKWEFYLAVSLLLSLVLLILKFFYSYFPLFSLNAASPLFLAHVLVLYFRKAAFRLVNLGKTNLVPARAHLKLCWWKNFTLIWAEQRLKTEHPSAQPSSVQTTTTDPHMPLLSTTPFWQNPSQRGVKNVMLPSASPRCLK